MTVKVKLELNIKDYKSMAAFLATHEGDIAHDCNDFGGIRGLYEAVFEVKPEKGMHGERVKADGE